MGVGAGIVFDSDAQEEYAECQLKGPLPDRPEKRLRDFRTMHATRTGGVRHRERHLKRLAASAACFGYAWDAAAADASLDTACAMLEADTGYRLRLALNAAGAFSVQHAPIAPLTEAVRVLLAPDATEAGDLFLRHKTSIRSRYDAAWREARRKALSICCSSTNAAS